MQLFCNKHSPHRSGLGPDPKPKLRGDTRTFRVWLDPNQYQQDMTSSIQSGTEDPYETFNIIMRRKPKENNFKVCIPCWGSDQSSVCIAPQCFIFRPWALVLPAPLQSDVLHILYSLGYCSCKVGARAALRLPPIQGLLNDRSETLLTGFSCDVYPPPLTFKNPLVAASRHHTFMKRSERNMLYYQYNIEVPWAEPYCYRREII